MRQIAYCLLLLVIFFLGACTGCSKSGKYGKASNVSNEERPQSHDAKKTSNSISERTTIYMVKEQGVYKIPVLINGSKMEFILDTGAGLISISNVEASFMLKQGTLTREDVLGQADFYDANGDVSVGTIIRLKQVSIGGREIYDVEASVVDNSVAPLLLGQSALEKFGKFSVDYSNNTLTFE
jgi:aspartyl protease family protein